MKVRRDFGADEDCEPVIVPRNDKSLVAVAPERVRRLREHLIGTLREMRPAKPWVHSVSPALPDPTGFPARVAHTACSLCKTVIGARTAFSAVHLVLIPRDSILSNF